ncbi:cell division cycle- protein [Tulasnella sp. 403]|nr:cell division cycle- protein [Tulasnella sp. 403]
MAYYASSSPPRPEHSSFAASEPNSPSFCSRIDDASFLSTDLDVSFASVSVNSDPATPNDDSIDGPDTAFLAPDAMDAMDISPAPHRPASSRRSPAMPVRRRSNTVGTQRAKAQGLPDDRAFGRELSNASSSPPQAPITIRHTKASPQASPVASVFDQATESPKALSARQRGGLPTAWLLPKPSNGSRPKRAGGIFSTQTVWSDSSPDKSMREDTMDLDASACKPVKSKVATAFVTSSPPPADRSAEGSDLGSFFFESTSPSAGLIVSRKRRSEELDRDQENHEVPLSRPGSSGGKGRRGSASHSRNRSSSPTSSPSLNRGGRGMDRFATTGASLLFGANKRSVPRRPGLSTLVQSSDSPTSNSGPKSAHAGLYGPSSKRVPSTLSAMPISRRAFSAQVPPKSIIDMAKMSYDSEPETEGEDESFDLNACSPIPLPRRNAPQRSVSCAQTSGPNVLKKLQEAMSAKIDDDDDDDMPIEVIAAGISLPREGEVKGRILPCFSVKEDSIARITPDTMEDLLAGVYHDQMMDLHIIDCRFKYEYDGGHIPGATNLGTAEDVENYFLKERVPPAPTDSGEVSPHDELKSIVIFHCEFSAKRGPTFAKHLRAQDRKSCLDVYPKIHYPEVYVLQGGYKAFYEAYPDRCEGYVTMDDPQHIEARRENIDNLRRWERTRSYTYGERTAAAAALGNGKNSTNSSRPSSTSVAASAAANTSSKAANAALGRRGGTAARLELSTLAEHDDTSFCTTEGDSSFGGVGDSPCVAAKTKTVYTTSNMNPNKRPGRPPLDRAITIGPLSFGSS